MVTVSENANATKWLATQISEFGDTERENVSAWIRRVDKVAHGAMDVILLATSSKLKNAKQWYKPQDDRVMAEPKKRTVEDFWGKDAVL